MEAIDYSPVLERFVEILQPVLGNFKASIYPVDERTVELRCDTADDNHHRYRFARVELEKIKVVSCLAEFAAWSFANYLFENEFISQMPDFTPPAQLGRHTQ